MPLRTSSGPTTALAARREQTVIHLDPSVLSTPIGGRRRSHPNRAALAGAIGFGVPARVAACLASIRWQDVMALQGPPLLGAMYALSARSVGSVASLAILVVANACLVAHVFVLNDWSDSALDASNPHKATGAFAARGVRPSEMIGLAAALLGASTVLFARLGAIPLGLSLAIVGASGLYSLPAGGWKGKPLLGTAAHLIGGTLHFLLGASLAGVIDPGTVAAATFCALTFAAGHVTQEVRDHESDARSGIRTNAVVFGPRRAFCGGVALFTLAQALLLFLALRGTYPRPVALLVLLHPLHLRWSLAALREGLTHASVQRLQVRYRLTYAVIGLAITAALFLDGVVCKS